MQDFALILGKFNRLHSASPPFRLMPSTPFCFAFHAASLLILPKPQMNIIFDA